jgi:hypothetical protein
MYICNDQRKVELNFLLLLLLLPKIKARERRRKSVVRRRI